MSPLSEYVIFIAWLPEKRNLMQKMNAALNFSNMLQIKLYFDSCGCNYLNFGEFGIR